jgi:hypothetical protein
VALAMVSLYSAPDVKLLEKLFNTVYLCRYQGQEALQVVPVQLLVSVVAMVPLDPEDRTTVYLVEKPGLDMDVLASKDEIAAELDAEGEDDVDN